MKEQRINPKLGVAWYPDNWHKSGTFNRMRSKPELQLAYLNVIWHLTREGGSAVITKDMVKTWINCRQMRESTWLGLRSEFTVDDHGFWGHKSVDKRIKKSLNYSEMNKERKQNAAKFGSNSGSSLGHNPIKGGLELKSVPIPPTLKNKNESEQTEIPDWAKEEKA